MRYLITGGCGFLGSNIAAEVIRRGDELVIFDSLYRHGSRQNLAWLAAQGTFEFVHGDIRNANDVERLVVRCKPHVIYHLAGQVAMTTSIDDPRGDFETNTCGSFNLLNAVRLHSPESAVIYSSTNKVYGDLEQYSYEETDSRYICQSKPNGFDESTPLDFHSPYGVSKGSADQYMLDFARVYGLCTVVFRHSSMCGGRQYATVDQGWVGWFTQKALEIKACTVIAPFTISGNGKQVRDLLYASDCVELYLEAASKIDQLVGQAFNIGGGMENSLSLLELFALLESELGIQIDYQQLPVRESDQRVFVADNTKATNLIGWRPKVDRETTVREIVRWLSS
jgi:CDP-paratose 2-epimerase